MIPSPGFLGMVFDDDGDANDINDFDYDVRS